MIYPVILPVPFKDKKLTGKEKVLRLSRHARYALNISAQKSGVILSNVSKDKKGIPIPCNGNYWSLTHKSEYVGAVVARTKIGIDIEKIRPCSKSLFKKIAGSSEWIIADNNEPYKLFFRYWTSKEAVLKANGTGLKDLSKCRVTQVFDNSKLIINYKDKSWLIEHCFFDKHIASVVINGLHVEWTFCNNKIVQPFK